LNPISFLNLAAKSALEKENACPICNFPLT
jgi:hypothetical protein